ncbi:NUDIX hydrolase [Polaribacter sp. SA4-12]|uniref:NUDIX hydrolase n=1 Tax=Polaribacter sp. SA4-12 TaxID=1312072 RepID=UPI000B3C03D8|nr:NUDIX domain-containing protein [Polaribacter sp. SA4-12]ARV15426.1 DNA mismatch repair protein MutT [Polaribacter sp. SA4-12]
MREIDKIAFIELRNGKILSSKSKGKNKFYIPGGKREKEETDRETLIREVKEELSVDIIASSIKYFGTFSAQSDGDKEGVIVKMTCYKATFTGQLKANNEIEVLKWLDSSNLEIISEVDKKIFHHLKENKELK